MKLLRFLEKFSIKYTVAVKQLWCLFEFTFENLVVGVEGQRTTDNTTYYRTSIAENPKLSHKCF